MGAHTEPQVIKQGNQPAFAVIPWDEYQELVSHYVPDESDVWFPQDVVEANAVRGESLIKAWREHFGLTQADLAAKAGMAQSAVARAERPGARPRTSTLKNLAVAMNLSVAQLVD